MDRAGVERWLQAYRKAWSSDAKEDVEALFTEDVSYSPFPWPRGENRWQGRDAVVREWQGRGDSKIDWRFEHNILAVEGDTAVIEGWTEYGRGPNQPEEQAYANIWLVRFADDGGAREFAEWWVERPHQAEG